jgi:hypothetical protein
VLKLKYRNHLHRLSCRAGRDNQQALHYFGAKPDNEALDVQLPERV